MNETKEQIISNLTGYKIEDIKERGAYGIIDCKEAMILMQTYADQQTSDLQKQLSAKNAEIEELKRVNEDLRKQLRPYNGPTCRERGCNKPLYHLGLCEEHYNMLD